MTPFSAVLCLLLYLGALALVVLLLRALAIYLDRFFGGEP